MKTVFRSSFARDLRRIREASLRRRIQQAIEQIEMAETLGDIPTLTKMSGGGSFYRIRLGDYRLGVAVEDEEEVKVEVESREQLHGTEVVDFGQGSVGFYRP